ncbi:MAG: hypothetical protein ACJA13_000839 [Paraglaciecola sp.]|jgi:hypothetical protein
MGKITFTFLLLCSVSFSLVAKGTYLSSEQFIGHAFNGNVPKVQALWLSAQDKTIIGNIMSRPFNLLRVHYWQQDEETVWIIDEIGKEKPITIGVHIKQKKIVELKVLAFRESRGDEVRHSFFTTQFTAAKLDQENQLTQSIDGITGATLSVWALTKVARLALWLNNKAVAE